MSYIDSICFSAYKAEELNKKAFSLDKRLFLFAYYEPKPYISEESARSHFCTAIINIYGLFWDCSPFFRALLANPSSILITKDWRKNKDDFYDLYNIVSAFRSIFCHNNSSEFPLNEENRILAESWVGNILSSKIEIEGIEALNEDHWEKLLLSLCKMGDVLVENLNINLDLLNTTTNIARKKQTIDQWITAIAGSYLTNPEYLLNAMAGMYQIYTLNTGIHINSHLRSETLKWLEKECHVDKQSWYVCWLDQTRQNAIDSKVYALLKDWENQWGLWNNLAASECNEAPLPSSIFFLILASDVYSFANQPHLGYHPNRDIEDILISCNNNLT